MRIRHSLLIATAVLLLGAGLYSAPHVKAQDVGTSSLTGTACAGEDYGGPQPMSDSGSTGSGETKPQQLGCNGPLPNATVHLTKAGPLANSVAGVDRTATTDANGAFSFDKLPDAKGYTLAISRTHFKSETRTVDVAGATMVPDVPLAGESVKQPGRVVGPEGKGVAGAEVSVCCDPAQSMAGSPPPTATTAADGSFSLATVAGYRSISVTGASGFEDKYDYRLLDGTPVAVTLVRLPPPDAFLQGSVRDQDGNAIAGIRVDASNYGNCCPEPYMTADASGSGGASGGGGTASSGPAVARPYFQGGTNHTVTDGDGHYFIGVFSGTVNIQVAKDGYATRFETVQVEKGATMTHDIKLLKYPAKTAHIEGTVANADGKGLRAVSISVRSPLYGLYECSSNGLEQSPPYPVMQAKPMAVDSMPIRAPDNACAITVSADGAFAGNVTPGYTIVDVYYQSYLDCTTTTDADGTTTSKCGPDYFSWTRTLDLPAGKTTQLDIGLVQRPGPDATVSGYVLDGETGKPIPHANLQFSNQDNYGAGQAATDGDGSFKVRLRSGYHTIMVNVYAKDGSPSGYLSWQGILDLPAGDSSFDVELTPGQDAGGGFCCYMGGGGGGFATPMAASDHAHASSAQAPAQGAAAGGPAAGAPDGSSQSTQAQAFEDLGGGLGPYNAADRGKLIEPDTGTGTKTSPHLELPVLTAIFGLAAIAARRRQV